MNQIKDKFKRHINYMRLSITDRCNLRCRYCMPPDGVSNKPREDILSYEELGRIVKAGVELGVEKVRITGGEPLVRKGIINFINMLDSIEDLNEISMTTNGVLLTEKAEQLKRAGLERVNISLDTLKEEKYEEITRLGDWDKAWKGVTKAINNGLDPVKINVVILQDFNQNEIENFVELTKLYPLHIRFIEYMPFSKLNKQKEDKYLSLTGVLKQLQRKYNLTKSNVEGGGPADYYSIPDTPGTIGLIRPISHGFCRHCNRIRITADGKIKPCLESNTELNLRKDELLKEGSLENIKSILVRAIKKKPAKHMLNEKDRKRKRNMSQIGG